MICGLFCLLRHVAVKKCVSTCKYVFPCLAVKCKLFWPDRDDEAKDQQIDTRNCNYNKHFFSLNEK